ncbi:13527_t:CDS:2 [Funneliformis caledonium]|uniref:13527_t:CDS:1 n=1 Tax=Funneliformis caledonium TaxID=1117310 RepID=A0A9N9CJH2_9GLOM|nr:13527_t:CDS:2 [Funneliformis caledonium]
MDYTMHFPNSNHAVNNHFNFTTSQIHSPTNAGRKRTRSNSINRNEHVQKTVRLLSPPRFKGNSSFPNPQFSCWNENRLSRSNSINDLSNKTQLLAVQETTHVGFMDYDNMQIDLERFDDDEIIQHHETDITKSTYSSPIRGQRQQHRQVQLHQLPFTMGRRLDCEKCRLRVPGHFSHVLSH